jgi:hypothetical protein
MAEALTFGHRSVSEKRISTTLSVKNTINWPIGQIMVFLTFGLLEMKFNVRFEISKQQAIAQQHQVPPDSKNYRLNLPVSNRSNEKERRQQWTKQHTTGSYRSFGALQRMSFATYSSVAIPGCR